MATVITEKGSDLYHSDETAWLEHMAELIRTGRTDDVDFSNLAEYLSDMARRDRREVESRLALLLAHLLKWKYQPGRRSGSWQATIIVQRQELQSQVERGVLRNHSLAMIDTCYARAVEQAIAETELPDTTFPPACPWTLDEALSAETLSE